MPRDRTGSNLIIGSVFTLAGMAGTAEAWAAPTAMRDCDQCPELVVIPAGRFTMGATPGDQGAEDDEAPPPPFA